MGGSPELFEQYFEKVLKKSCLGGKEFIFINAWNEWGGQFQPDDTPACDIPVLKKKMLLSILADNTFVVLDVYKRQVEGASHFQRQGTVSTGSFHLLASLVDSFDRT